MKGPALSLSVLLVVSCTNTEPGPQPGAYAGTGPIIDMHLHAHALEEFLDHRRSAPIECALPTRVPPFNPRDAESSDLAAAYFLRRLDHCGRHLVPPETEAELIEETLKILEQYDIFAVTSSSIADVRRWHQASPARIIPALAVVDPAAIDPRGVRELAGRGEIAVLGEIATQYLGLAANDPRLDALFGLAEELDLPVGIHVGLSAPGIPVVTLQGYRAGRTHPLDLEDVLQRHPGLRVYVMHAGWPMLDEMLHLLWSYPQVYVDVGVLGWLIPRREFHHYLRRLVEAGFGQRIMFGSDQMIWPEAIVVSIESIEAADFLSPQQKRDIFYNNAARFLRLSEAAIAAHHGR